MMPRFASKSVGEMIDELEKWAKDLDSAISIMAPLPGFNFMVQRRHDEAAVKNLRREVIPLLRRGRRINPGWEQGGYTGAEEVEASPSSVVEAVEAFSINDNEDCYGVD